jgi:hypothetical protein
MLQPMKQLPTAAILYHSDSSQTWRQTWRKENIIEYSLVVGRPKAGSYAASTGCQPDLLWPD